MIILYHHEKYKIIIIILYLSSTPQAEPLGRSCLSIARSALSLARSARAERDNDSCFFAWDRYREKDRNQHEEHIISSEWNLTAEPVSRQIPIWGWRSGTEIGIMDDGVVGPGSNQRGAGAARDGRGVKATRRRGVARLTVEGGHSRGPSRVDKCACTSDDLEVTPPCRARRKS
ncbi:hypothetical protein EVAR_6928_1 [Eumeta japonica]|uniref:Uncharacterized protein n=1 Tax=Eumeta variegata TaxID=151549 RepID=A0A4C1THI4_EUMVA|nr:hypothetical protein EVAR_6928_1 [Eumeta japonica]